MSNALQQLQTILAKHSSKKNGQFPPGVSKELVSMAVRVHENGDAVQEADFDKIYMDVYKKQNTLGKGGIFKGNTFAKLAGGKIGLTTEGLELVENYGGITK